MTKTGTGTDRLVGDVLDGRYEVLQRLARGGMATVYRAWDRRLERIVAIKVMHEGLGDDADFVAKFDREARSAARLSDKSVVSIFDQGHDHGRPYIVMEFVEGSTLRSVITREAPISPLRAVQLIEPVAAALAAAHESGLVHRDVKPENVLISNRGAVKVADFGLARVMTNQTSTHTQGLLIGTVSYLPPELLTTGRAQPWSDVYSTGIMLFEMLTGAKPYTGDAPITVAYRHVNEDVPLPSEVLASKHPGRARRDPVPDYLDALVAACTRRNPQARPADGRELLRRVRAVKRALERGVRSDDALATMVFPAAAMPWAIDQTQVIAPEEAATSVLAAVRPEAVDESPVDHGGPVTPVEPMPAVVEPSVRPRPVEPYRPPRPAAVDVPASERFPRLSQRTYRRRRAFLVTVLVLVLTLTVGTGSWWLASGRYVTTPAVVNQPQSEAVAIAEANGMAITFTEAYSETVPAGIVISSDPAPGERALRNATMTAVVSLGPERYPAPALVGLMLDDARQALTAANLQAGEVTEAWDEQAAVGVVVWASQAEGELLKRGTAVDLTISKGREPLTIPSVVNMRLVDAQKTLTEAGFQVTTGSQANHDTIPAGSVISQQPAGGTGHRGDTVTLVVSKGQQIVKLPRVERNDAVADASKKLTDAGLEVEVQWEGDLPIRQGRVVRLTDAAGKELAEGDELPKGSVVVIRAT